MISKIVEKNGSRVFEIDGKTYLPFAYRSFRPTPANIALFHRAGIRLYQMLCSGLSTSIGPYSLYGAIWVGDHQYNFTPFDLQMQMFRRFAPEGRFMVMIQLDTPKWWLDAHPGTLSSFRHLGDTVHVQEWINDASDYLRAFIEYAEEKYGDYIFAYAFSSGMATEWFDGDCTEGISDLRLQKYREWLGDPNAPVPTAEEMLDASNPVFRDPDSPVATFYRFAAQYTPKLIKHYAAEAQKVLNHNKIVGLFFGYSDCPNGYWQNRTATNGYEEVWRDPNIDMLFSPAAYGEARDMDKASSYQFTIDSVELNGKFYLHEIDHRTYLAGYPTEYSEFWPLDEAYPDFETTQIILRRELCATAVKDGALWWFDFLGNYYSTPEMEAELAHEMKVLEKIWQKEHESISEIAAFLDPMSFLTLKDETMISRQIGRHNRNSLHECGAPYDFFNFSDLKKLDPKKYKMLAFLNTMDISDDVVEYLNTTLKDVLKVWVYAPGYVTDNKLSIDNIKRVTGIAVHEVNSSDIMQIDYAGKKFGFNRAVTPIFVADDDNENEVIARFESGECGVVRRGNNVLISTGNVSAELWHDLAESVGVHMFCKAGGAFYADSRFVARQTVHETDCEIKLPYDCTLEELFDGGTYKTENGVLRYKADRHETKLFLIKDRS